ncbi:MAG: cytochrome C [Bacteroidetes bacterium]|nr:cytochrome C [Bacteroidota bacterium]
MKKVLRILLMLLLVIIVAIAGLLIYVKAALPDVGPPPDITIEITPERLERGEYLAHHVWLCMDCHSDRDWRKFSAPPIAGTEGSGGDEFTREMGFPGHYYATNITPGGIGDWTDGEIYRAITSGVSKDGRALFPIMPYPYLAKADKEDVYSVIAYIKTLPAVEKSYPEPESDFPMNFIINMIPGKTDHHPAPDPVDKIAYGEYLAWSCIECHTVAEKGTIVIEEAFAGGREFPLLTGGTVYSPNITPDNETGIGKWSEEQFIRRFKQYIDSNYVSQHVADNTFNTYMPWEMFAGMTVSDLSALYTYLMDLEPKTNKVVRFVPDND